MKLPELKNVKVVEKPERGRYEDKDVHEKSSKVVLFNLFDQDWTDLQREGLAHLFNNDRSVFERRKEQRNEAIQEHAGSAKL